MVRAGLKASPLPPLALSRRSVTDDDREFLYALFRDCLPPSNGFDALPPAERETLLLMQFEARERQYRTIYALADFDLLLLDEAPIGNLYVDRGDDEQQKVEVRQCINGPVLPLPRLELH